MLHIPIVHAHDVSKQIPREKNFSIGHVSVRSSRYEARGKFGEHERCVRVARGVAESTSSKKFSFPLIVKGKENFFDQNLSNYGYSVEYQGSKNTLTYWLVWLNIISDKKLGSYSIQWDLVSR